MKTMHVARVSAANVTDEYIVVFADESGVEVAVTCWVSADGEDMTPRTRTDIFMRGLAEPRDVFEAVATFRRRSVPVTAHA